jgi:hypothetical protein
MQNAAVQIVKTLSQASVQPALGISLPGAARLWPNPQQAIERFSPLLTISGHDHQTPIRTGCRHYRIGQTTCVNVGQTDSGPLRYCGIEAEFKSASSTLRSLFKKRAQYPQGQVFVSELRSSSSVIA